MVHISLIVSSKGAIWGDDSEDLRFIVLHVELRSQQGAFDVFLSLMTGATLKCKKFSCQKEKNWGPPIVPPPFTKNETLEGAIKERCWALPDLSLVYCYGIEKLIWKFTYSTYTAIYRVGPQISFSTSFGAYLDVLYQRPESKSQGES